MRSIDAHSELSTVHQRRKRTDVIYLRYVESVNPAAKQICHIKVAEWLLNHAKQTVDVAEHDELNDTITTNT